MLLSEIALVFACRLLVSLFVEHCLSGLLKVASTLVIELLLGVGRPALGLGILQRLLLVGRWSLLAGELAQPRIECAAYRPQCRWTKDISPHTHSRSFLIRYRDVWWKNRVF